MAIVEGRCQLLLPRYLPPLPLFLANDIYATIQITIQIVGKEVLAVCSIADIINIIAVGQLTSEEQ